MKNTIVKSNPAAMRTAKRNSQPVPPIVSSTGKAQRWIGPESDVKAVDSRRSRVFGYVQRVLERSVGFTSVLINEVALSSLTSQGLRKK